MCELYYCFGSFQTPPSVRLITSRHYLLEPNVADTKNGRRTNEGGKAVNPKYKYTGLGAAITAELMIGLWFGIGVTLAIGVVDGLNHFIGMFMNSGNKWDYH